MRGFTYKEIAIEAGLSVDKTVDCIEKLTRDFRIQSKVIIRYVCYRYNVENDAFGYCSSLLRKVYALQPRQSSVAKDSPTASHSMLLTGLSEKKQIGRVAFS